MNKILALAHTLSRYPAKRRAAKARAALAETLFIEAAKRLIEDDDRDRSYRRSRSSADVLAERVLSRRPS